MKSSWLSPRILVLILLVMAVLMLIMGLRVYTRTTVTQIDSLRVQSTDVKTLKSQFPSLFRAKNLSGPEWADSSKVLALSIYHKHDSTPLSDKDRLQAIDQFYYNTYDRLINTLAILLTTASIFIAFFGGVIPYIRSEKAEKLLEKVTLQVDEARKAQTHLEDLVNRSQEVEARVRKLIDSLKKRAEEIRGKIVARSGNIDEILTFTPSTRQQLQEHYEHTETLLNLGEELDRENVMMRCIFYIANHRDQDYDREFAIWTGIDPSDRPYIVSGIAFENADNPLRSIACYDRAMQIRPNNSIALYNKGIALGALRRFDEALPCYTQALQLKPDFQEAWINKGIAYFELGQYEEAIRCHDQALSILPDDPDAWFNKGNAHAKLGDCAEAAKCFGHALRVNPTNPESWYNQGNALGCMSDFTQAISCYDQALKYRPDYPEALCNKAFMLIQLARSCEALPILDAALALKPDFKDALVNKGNAFQALEQYPEALGCYALALRLAPDDHEALLNQGVTLRATGDYPAALAALEEAARIRPADAATWLELARTHALFKNREQMLTALKSALEIDPALKQEIRDDSSFSTYVEDAGFSGLLV